MIENKKVIGCYIRLSDEDDETASGIKDESNSVSAQRQLIRMYIDTECEFRDYRTKEYVDDGYTGTTFTRPGFERMMEDAKRGDIGIIIVKDFSRLGRDHLETGNLLERIFPLLGIRFISVNDSFDSAECDGMTGGLNVALKNVMNSMYSRDLSNKVRSAMRTRARSGQYMSSKVAYGYLKDPEDIHHLVVDEEAATIVREIFGFAAEGKNKKWICGYLNSNDIPTPSQYMISKGLMPAAHRNQRHPRWTVTTISDMLRNQIYKGNTCWNKSEQNITTGKKQVKNHPDEWIIVEGTHEPIVSKELFEKANNMAFTGKKSTHIANPCPLIYCAYCGRTLAAPKDGNHIRYRCMNGYGEFAEKACSLVRIKSMDLELAILANVNLMASLYAEKLSHKRNVDSSEITTLSDKITKMGKEAERISASKTRLYEEYRDNGDRSTYIENKAKADARLSEIQNEISVLEKELEQAKLNEDKSSKAKEVIREVGTIEKFDKVKLKKLIERVDVYAADKIEIIWKPLDPLFENITEETGHVDL